MVLITSLCRSGCRSGGSGGGGGRGEGTSRRGRSGGGGGRGRGEGTSLRGRSGGDEEGRRRRGDATAVGVLQPDRVHQVVPADVPLPGRRRPVRRHLPGMQALHCGSAPPRLQRPVPRRPWPHLRQGRRLPRRRVSVDRCSGRVTDSVRSLAVYLDSGVVSVSRWHSHHETLHTVRCVCSRCGQ
jgi:hypothetical protein